MMSTPGRYISKRERAEAAALAAKVAEKTAEAEPSSEDVNEKPQKRGKLQPAQPPVQQTWTLPGHTKGVNTIKWRRTDGYQGQCIRLTNTSRDSIDICIDGRDCENLGCVQ